MLRLLRPSSVSMRAVEPLNPLTASLGGSLNNDTKSSTIGRINLLNKDSSNPQAGTNKNRAQNNGKTPDLVKSARNDALTSRLTGPMAGRTVSISGSSVNFNSSFTILNSLLRSSNIQQMTRDQKVYLKPSKKHEMLRARKHRIRFKKAFVEMMSLVNDAKRRGY